VPLPLVLLPGLHGTAGLFAPFVALAPDDIEPLVVPLPLEESAYERILPRICARLPNGRFAILGESFSGPLAVAISQEMPERVVGVILANSFVTSPRTTLFRFLPWRLIFRVRPPRWSIRLFILGWHAADGLVDAVRNAIAVAAPRVLARRMRAIFTLSLPRGEKVAVPVLLLFGTRDRLVPIEHPALLQLSDRVRTVKIRAPHLLLQTAPHEAWAAIAEFLATEA
jgi:pimeloyl-ACP methyl ester carboxylesterase